MPKSKVRKQTAAATTASRTTQVESASLRAKVATPSGPVFLSIMLGMFVVGLLWLIVFYLWGDGIPFMQSLGNWNFGIAFGLLIAGLIMTMRWR
ncbi:MAG: cell division protein CrgA [Nakamurella sp.]